MVRLSSENLKSEEECSLYSDATLMEGACQGGGLRACSNKIAFGSRLPTF